MGGNFAPKYAADSDSLRKHAKQPVTISGFAKATGEGLNTSERDIENYHSETDSYVLSGTAERGMSGGPAVRNGQLVGVIFATDRRRHKTYMVPVTAIRSFLQTYVSHPNVPKQPSGFVKGMVRYVNRTPQLDQMAEILAGDPRSDQSPNSGLVISLLPCHPEDRPRYFRHRLEDGEAAYDADSDHPVLNPGLDVYDVPLPQNLSVDEAFVAMKARLTSSLSADTDSADAILRVMNRRPGPVVVYSGVVVPSGALLLRCTPSDVAGCRQAVIACDGSVGRSVPSAPYVWNIGMG